LDGKDKQNLTESNGEDERERGSTLSSKFWAIPVCRRHLDQASGDTPAEAKNKTGSINIVIPIFRIIM